MFSLALLSFNCLIDCLEGGSQHTCRRLSNTCSVPYFLRRGYNVAEMRGVRPRNSTPQKMIHVAVNYELAGEHLQWSGEDGLVVISY